MRRWASSLSIVTALSCEATTDAASVETPMAQAAPASPNPAAPPTPLVPTKTAAPGAGGAELIGDPEAQERSILGLDNADLPEDVLLALPGSSGIAVDDAEAANVPAGGRSVGTPQAGSLRAGVQLPPRPHLYTRRDPARSFGSTHTIRTIFAALTAMRTERSQIAEVIIGDISRPTGGPFAPHVSHQTGRDIDIRLVLRADVPRATLPSAPEVVDWDATWALVHSFLETGQVVYVFLDYDRQQYLYDAARRAGVDARVLDTWFQWPTPGAFGPIRHEDGHRAHVHVRLACGPDDHECAGS